MRLHNFFINETIPEEKEFVLNDVQLFHQLKHVFRMNVGSQVILLDNSGFEYVSEVVSFARGALTFHVREKRKNKNISHKEIFLFQSIIKKDKFEWVLEKGTELGASYFVPLLSMRSEKKDVNVERGRKILKEAAEQSGRGKLPELFMPVTLDQVLKDNTMSGIVFDQEGKKFTPGEFKEERIAVFIGPEGGWEPKEIGLFKAKHIPIFSLGNQVLRSETAALAALSLLLL